MQKIENPATCKLSELTFTTMRVTVWMLLECVGVDDLALLIESYIQPIICDITGEWFPSLTSGHMEHIQDCLTDRKHLDMIMAQACEIGDLSMIKQLIILGEKRWNNGFLAAKRFNQIEAACVMIANGADVNYINREYVAYDENCVGSGLDDRFDEDMVPMYTLLLENGFKNIDEMIDPITVSDDTELFNLFIKQRLTTSTLEILFNRIGNNNSINVAIQCVNFFRELSPMYQRTVTSRIMKDAGLDRSITVIKYLLSENADPNLCVNAACSCGQTNALKLLLAAGATCGCGKTNDEHTDEYLTMNFNISARMHLDRLMGRVHELDPSWDT